ncbi:MAG: MscS Mechanosensitive ion channel [Verrucomicrobia bacterium]|nr:MscS Mechanosensitive ion channel [Verrucomicrobiota bacterium]
MKRLFVLFLSVLALVISAPARAADPVPADKGAAATTVSPAQQADDAQVAVLKTNAAAAVTANAAGPRVRPPDLLEHFVDEILNLFNVRSSGNTATHYVISLLLIVGALLLRRVVTGIIFRQLKRFASRTETTLDDKLFPALEAPVATFVMLVGIFAALKVLKLSETSDEALGYGSTVAFSLVLFWGLLRAFNALLDHAHEVALQKQMGIAAFMPWIKKTLVVVFVIFGVLLTAQSLGADVKAFLAGLGIGGLAFALAAQDTIANVFGSIVVAIDQPFKVGETVKIAAYTGTVEDIGLRSTKIRLIDRSLVIIPNKTVAAESIVNLSRFTQRRSEQTLGLPHNTPPQEIEAVLADLRAAIAQEKEVDPNSVVVTFNTFTATSLEVLVVYATVSSDALASIKLKERLNLAFMRVLAARNLGFAFPTQTVVLSRPAGKPGPEKKG